MPMISVLMSVYNGEKFLEESVQSILRQSFKDFEFIIINDCSTDNTELILNNLSKIDNRIKVIKNENNFGLTKSLNIGLAKCNGRYIARQDADDISEPERLQKQFDYMEANPNTALSGTCGLFIDENGKVVKEKKIPLTYLEIKKKLLFNNQFIHSSLIMRQDILKREGGYNEKFKKSQDYELVLRVAFKYSVINLPEILVKRRLLSTAISWSSKKQEWDAIRARWWAITKYHYSIWQGLLNILLRFGWIIIPQKIKLRRNF